LLHFNEISHFQVSNFVKIRRVVPCRRTDKQTDRYGKTNSRFSQFCERA